MEIEEERQIGIERLVVTVHPLLDKLAGRDAGGFEKRCSITQKI